MIECVVKIGCYRGLEVFPKNSMDLLMEGEEEGLKKAMDFDCFG